jgi:hypothetical protein
MTSPAPSSEAISEEAVFECLPGLEAATHIDGMTLKHPTTGAYFSLNATGAFLWKLLGERHDLSAIKQTASTHFAAPRDITDPTIDAFIGGLVDAGLLTAKPFSNGGNHELG